MYFGRLFPDQQPALSAAILTAFSHAGKIKVEVGTLGLSILPNLYASNCLTAAYRLVVPPYSYLEHRATPVSPSKSSPNRLESTQLVPFLL